MVFCQAHKKDSAWTAKLNCFLGFEPSAFEARLLVVLVGNFNLSGISRFAEVPEMTG